MGKIVVDYQHPIRDASLGRKHHPPRVCAFRRNASFGEHVVVWYKTNEEQTGYRESHSYRMRRDCLTYFFYRKNHSYRMVST